jgi:hypothetical protein
VFLSLLSLLLLPWLLVFIGWYGYANTPEVTHLRTFPIWLLFAVYPQRGLMVTGKLGRIGLNIFEVLTYLFPG